MSNGGKEGFSGVFFFFLLFLLLGVGGLVWSLLSTMKILIG